MEPNGLLAAGGDLSVERLLGAYQRGIFPWYSEGEPILWWSPDPRCILWPADIRLSRNLQKTLRNTTIEVRADTAFREVISRCSMSRPGSIGTWITGEMLNAYCVLHQLGHARSIECWQDNQLVGGLYGVAIDGVFFGESMFSAARDASKIALVHLARNENYAARDASKIALVHLARNENYQLIDCQLPSAHLQSMGAITVSRREFIETLDELLGG